MVSGAAHTGTAGVSEDDADFLGLPGLLTADQEATLLRSRDERARRVAKGSRRLTIDGDPLGLSRAARMTDDLVDPMLVRRALATAVSERAQSTGQAHADVYAALMRLVPGPRSADATVRTLKARLAALAQL